MQRYNAVVQRGEWIGKEFFVAGPGFGQPFCDVEIGLILVVDLIQVVDRHPIDHAAHHEGKTHQDCREHDAQKENEETAGALDRVQVFEFCAAFRLRKDPAEVPADPVDRLALMRLQQFQGILAEDPVDDDPGNQGEEQERHQDRGSEDGETLGDLDLGQEIEIQVQFLQRLGIERSDEVAQDQHKGGEDHHRDEVGPGYFRTAVAERFEDANLASFGMEQVVDQDRYDDDGDGRDEDTESQSHDFSLGQFIIDGPAPHAGLRVRNLADERQLFFVVGRVYALLGQVHAG